MGERALIVIDVQQAVYDEIDPAYDAPGFLQRLTGLIDSARAAGVPVIHVQHDSGPGDSLEHGTPGWAIHPAIVPLPGEPLIEKRTPDSFVGTDLQAHLAAQGITDLVLCGMQTDCCVEATTQGAARLGFAVTLVADVHTTGAWGGKSAAEVIVEKNRSLAEIATVKPAAEINWLTAR